MSFLGLISILGGIFGEREELNMTPKYRAIQESQKQFEITINQLNQFQQIIIEDFNNIKEENKSKEIIKQINEELKIKKKK